MAATIFCQNREFIEELARHWQVIVPRHPGFGASERPDGFRTVHDLAYLYLDLLERRDLQDVMLVGSSFGGGSRSRYAFAASSGSDGSR
jgi:pimeloyl-ACP methyl ester carboxylesterase